MSDQVLTYRLRSFAPLMQHNGQLADPLNKWSKLMKAISSKRKKTDADLEELAKLEFFGSLYLNERGPAIPADCITAMLINAAKKHREGDLARTGVFCDDSPSLDYDGPRSPEDLWKDETFRDTRAVRVGTARIMRTRPVFPKWEATITLIVDDTVVNPSRVDEWMQTAGKVIGLLEMRPRLGRFTAERLN